MSALTVKEIRLLLPSLGMAIMLSIVPAWLLPLGAHDSLVSVTLYPFSFGAVLLALSSFGREFGLKTFSVLLAQPAERSRIWRTKIAVLSGSLVLAWMVWCLSCAACISTSHISRVNWKDALTMGGTAIAVTIAGGLWTTLLLRQVVAAFWFSILIPLAVIMMVDLSGAPDWMIFVLLGVYSVAGFLFARREFFRAQDAAWTGGVVSLPGFRPKNPDSRLKSHAYRPVAALLNKEFQLHHVGLIGIACLFLVHLGVVYLRSRELTDAIRKGLEVFGGIWLIVPLLVGGQSVAEERKLGTWQEQLCLPVSSRIQFLIKLSFVLLVGGVLSPVLLDTAESFGGVLGINERFGLFGHSIGLSILVFCALSLIGLYASTLSRSVIQALAIAVLVMMCLGAAAAFAEDPERTIGLVFWRGSLVLYVALPTLVTAFLWLAVRNLRSVAESGVMWWRNTVALGLTLIGIGVATTVIYHRAWELLLPLEPTPGPARLTAANSPRITSDLNGSLDILYADGRLRVDRITYVPGHQVLEFGKDTGIQTGSRWVNLCINPVVAGSNWVDSIATRYETIAIRSDGTLWVSETPREPWNFIGPPPRERASSLVQMGTESDWQSLGPEHPYSATSILLLKKDGTLWQWGTNSFPGKQRWPGLRTFAPARIGNDSDWSRMGIAGHCYLWKQDGSAWIVDPYFMSEPNLRMSRAAGIMRFRNLDQSRWRSLGGNWTWSTGVRDDGTLWTWNSVFSSSSGRQDAFSAQLVPLGAGSEWTSVTSDYMTLTALKKDGSLWQWSPRDPRTGGWQPTTARQFRLGSRNDWVAIVDAMGGTISLAADGSLWFWWPRGVERYQSSDQVLLAASRRPSRIGSIFDSPN